MIVRASQRQRGMGFADSFPLSYVGGYMGSMFGTRAALRRAGLRGLGMDYRELMAQAHLENCNSMDSACVSNNVAKQAAVQDYWINNGMKNAGGVPEGTVLNFTPQTQAEVKEFYDPSNLFFGGNTVDTRGVLAVKGALPQVTTSSGGGNPPATAVGIRGGSLSFTTSRGGTALQVGDRWTVQITGASPNMQVSATGGQNGARNITPMGTTDGAGSFSFTVAPVVTPQGNVVINSSAPPPGAASTPNTVTSILPTGFSLPDIPWWGWLAGGGALLFAMKGKH